MAISHAQILRKDPYTKKKRPQTLNLSTENLCPKTSLIMAAKAEEEDVEQEDMAYMAGRFRLP